MLTVTFWPHGTTFDNERSIASGHLETELSPLGIQQAREMGEKYRATPFAAVYSSDLGRARMTAELAFGGRGIPILADSRLRECDYGHLNGHPREEVESVRAQHLHTPFPGGESYAQVCERVRSVLTDAFRDYDGKHVMVIGHSATLWALLHVVRGMPLEEAVGQPVVKLLGAVFAVADMPPSPALLPRPREN